MLKYSTLTVLLFVAELLYFRIADHFNIIDRPNLRSSHTHITLRGGGIIFLIGAWLCAAFFGLSYPWFMTGLTLISLVSFIDDVHSTPKRVRLVVQFAAMFMMFHEVGFFAWHLWWAVLIALIVCVGIINAYNFMDGINGITGGYSLAVLLPLIAVNMLGTPELGGSGIDAVSSSCAGFIDNDLLLTVTLSALVFCYFNFRTKARCFAGDVGSVGMAFIVVFAIGMLMAKSNDYSWIMLLAVYGVDTVLTIVHRILLHENLGIAHRKHAYQIMANELRIPHVVVSLIYMALQLMVSAGLLFIPMNHYLYSAIVLVVLCLAYVVFMKKYYHLHEEYLKSVESKA